MESTPLGTGGAEHLLTRSLLNSVNKPPTTLKNLLDKILVIDWTYFQGLKSISLHLYTTGA